MITIHTFKLYKYLQFDLLQKLYPEDNRKIIGLRTDTKPVVNISMSIEKAVQTIMPSAKLTLQINTKCGHNTTLQLLCEKLLTASYSLCFRQLSDELNIFISVAVRYQIKI